jgi:DamX protein
MADQQLNEDSSRRKRRQGSSGKPRSHRHIFIWAAAALIIVVIVLIGIYYYPGISKSESHRFAQTIFRGKIEYADQPQTTTPRISSSKFSQENISAPKKDISDTPILQTETSHTATGILTPNKVAEDTAAANKVAETTAAAEQDDETLASAKQVVESSTPAVQIAEDKTSATKAADTTASAIKPIEIATASEPLPATKPDVESNSSAEKEGADKQTVNREDWLLSQRSSDFTIQIMGVRNENSIIEFIDRKLALAPTDIAYYKTSYKGKDWYPLLLGVYPTKKEANSAMKLLPPDLQKASPWIRKMSSIQRAIRKQTNP